MEEVAFNEDAARAHLIDRGVWPSDDAEAATGARGWWLHLLEKVTDAVNEHEWHDDAYHEDRYVEFTETAAEQMVAQARKTGAVMRLLDASKVAKAFGPDSEQVEQRLLSPLFDGDGTEGAYRHAGEDGQEYAERMARLRQQRREDCKKLLTLDGFCELYLTAAAVSVAGPWCQGKAEAWAEANPEPDEDEEDWDE